MDSVAVSVLEQSLKTVPSDFLQVEHAASELNLTGVVYGVAMVALMSVVGVIYLSRGIACCLRIACYLLSISTITLTVKNLYLNHHFTYCKFLTCMHFACAGTLGFGILTYRRMAEGKPITVPSLKQFLLMMPAALTFACSIAANNMALIYSNAGFVEMVASAGPLCAVVVVIAMGMEFVAKKWWPVGVVSIGMILCATGELKFSLMGFGLAFSGALARSVKATLQYKLMASDEGGFTLDPIELLAWICIPSSFIMFLWSIFTEGTAPFEHIAGKHRFSVMGAILLSCFNACILNVMNLFVIKDLGPVATQLCGQLKGVLIVIGGIAVFGEQVAPLQFLGFAMEIGGIFWYNKIDEEVKRQRASGAKPELESKPLLK